MRLPTFMYRPAVCFFHQRFRLQHWSQASTLGTDGIQGLVTYYSWITTLYVMPQMNISCVVYVDL